MAQTWELRSTGYRLNSRLRPINSLGLLAISYFVFRQFRFVFPDLEFRLEPWAHQGGTTRREAPRETTEFETELNSGSVKIRRVCLGDPLNFPRSSMTLCFMSCVEPEKIAHKVKKPLH
jgi:hypothetical protein